MSKGRCLGSWRYSQRPVPRERGRLALLAWTPWVSGTGGFMFFGSPQRCIRTLPVR